MPTLGVEIVIIEEGKVLLIKWRDFAVWALPGGGIDAGESAAEAAVREAQEETGLEVDDPGRPQTPIGRRRANTGRPESLFRRAWV